MRAAEPAGMRIEAHGEQLFVSWRNATRSQHDAWVEALRSLRGATFDRERRGWFVPAAQADRVLAKFPEASCDYEVICLAVDAQMRRLRTLYRNLVAGGFTLEVSGDRVVIGGAAATATLQSYLDSRPEFAEFVRSLDPAEIAAGVVAPPPPAQTPHMAQASDAEWRQGELLAASLSNAARNQYRAEVYARRGKKSRKNDTRLALSPVDSE